MEGPLSVGPLRHIGDLVDNVWAFRLEFVSLIKDGEGSYKPHRLTLYLLWSRAISFDSGSHLEQNNTQLLTETQWSVQRGLLANS